MTKVKKALIPVAGLGTRFLPITQAIPKEMLPIIDKPILLHIINECIDAGIEDIILIQGRNKDPIINFFDCNYELEEKLEQHGKTDILEELRNIRSSANIISIRQQEAKGLGHAVYTGKPIIGNSSFAVLLGDELMMGSPNPTKQLKEHYEKFETSCLSVMKVPKEEVYKYGIIEAELQNGIFEVRDLVEKPQVHETNSQLAIPGRYVFHSEIFDHIENTAPGKGGEIQLTDAMLKLAKSRGLHALEIGCKRYDTGDKLGYLIAVTEMALQHPELGTAYKQHLQNLLK